MTKIGVGVHVLKALELNGRNSVSEGSESDGTTEFQWKCFARES